VIGDGTYKAVVIEVELGEVWERGKVEGIKLAAEPSTGKAKFNDMACGVAFDAQP
jgi:hypothetical protein